MSIGPQGEKRNHGAKEHREGRSEANQRTRCHTEPRGVRQAPVELTHLVLAMENAKRYCHISVISFTLLS